MIVLLIALVRFIRAIRGTTRKTNEDEGSSTPSYSGISSRRANRRTTPEGRFSTPRARTPTPVIADQRTTNPRERQRLTPIEDDVTPPLLHYTDPGGGLPSAPPSYEEVVQVPYIPSAPIDDRSEPPPYSTNLM